MGGIAGALKSGARYGPAIGREVWEWGTRRVASMAGKAPKTKGPHHGGSGGAKPAVGKTGTSPTTGGVTQIQSGHGPIWDIIKRCARALDANPQYYGKQGSSGHASAHIEVTYPDPQGGTRSVNLGNHRYLDNNSLIKDVLRGLSRPNTSNELLKEARNQGIF